MAFSFFFLNFALKFFFFFFAYNFKLQNYEISWFCNLCNICRRLLNNYKLRLLKSQPTQTSFGRLQDVLKRSRRLTNKQDVVTTSRKKGQIYDVIKTSDLRRLKDIKFTTSWRRMVYDFLKTYDLHCLEDS